MGAPVLRYVEQDRCLRLRRRMSWLAVESSERHKQFITNGRFGTWENPNCVRFLEHANRELRRE